ncbi:hypothetical protein BJV78DRAFT_1273782 [Lactifluus subvellereus]|nr:hypothetical protein BJV78DRAFT_1273782 [Lactifluus subvellereus]
MAPWRKCTVCGSNQWHKEPATGLVVCSEGHVLQNYLNETHETQELGPHQRRKRALKSARERRERTGKANPDLYYGARAQYLYFQCLQLLLRKQIAALIRLWELPTEFEIICRDLWSLHLKPLLHKQATQGCASDDDSKSKGPTTAGDETATDPKGKKVSPERPGVSSSDGDGDDLEDDLEMDELLRALSESSSSDDDDTGQPRPKPEGTGRTSKTFSRNGPASNIALLMVACWTLRLPIMYLDLIRLIESYDLPYLEPLCHLPNGMVRHLTKHGIQALSPPHAPTTLFLHSLAARLARKMQGSYKIHTPELNAAPMLWRVVRALGGSPVLYNLGKIIAHVLSLPLALHHSLAPGLAHLKDDDPDSHKYDDVPAELALLVAVIIVLKMVYGLDGRPRLPKSSVDPACALPRMEDFLMTVKYMNEAYTKSKEVLFSASSELSILDLDKSMLDEYLDICQKGLLRPEMLRSGGETAIERPNGDQRALSAGVPVAGGRQEPGEGYAIYRSRDVLGALPEEMEMVISYGARWVGVEEEMILKVSEGYERRLWSWWARIRREEGIEARRTLVTV